MSTPFTLAVLLTSIIASPVEAAPYRRNVGLITLPLTRMHKVRDDVHPQILLQQHAHSAHRRLARMTGKREPTSEEMSAAIQKRLFVVGDGVEALRNKQQQKRKYNVGKVDSELSRLRDGSNANARVAVVQDTDVLAKTGCAGSRTTPVGDTKEGFSKVDLEAAINRGVTNSTIPNTPNTIALDNEANDVSYLTTLQLGNPPRDFRVIADSGSSDFWVGSETCKSLAGGGCGNHPFLGAKSSSSFKSLGRTFQVTYGTGQVAGDVITDDVVIAGLKLPAHTFGVASVESPDFSSNAQVDGLVGLAKSTLSEQKVDTPPESLAKAGLIQSAITSYKIPRLADAKNDGEITFGGIDETKIDPATLTTIANVNKQGFWEVPFTAAVNGADFGLNGRTAILDTGTSLIIAPPADAQAIHAQIPGAKSDGQGGFTIPCTTSAQVAFTMGGQSFVIDPRDLTFVPVNQNNLQGDCVSGIMSGQIGGPQEWLVGDVFLKNVYFSHDVGKNAITLAKLK